MQLTEQFTRIRTHCHFKYPSSYQLYVSL